MNNQKAIDEILLAKTTLVSESEFLQAQKRANGQYTPIEKARVNQIRVTLTEMNQQLIRLGYRKKATDLSENVSLCIMLRMKDIVTENFGRERANAFEEEARRRQETMTEDRIFPLLSPEEHRILESYKQWQRDKDRYAVLQRQIMDLKTLLTKRLSEESDYEKRKLYTEIFKML